MDTAAQCSVGEVAELGTRAGLLYSLDTIVTIGSLRRVLVGVRGGGGGLATVCSQPPVMGTPESQGPCRGPFVA